MRAVLTRLSTTWHRLDRLTGLGFKLVSRGYERSKLNLEIALEIRAIHFSQQLTDRLDPFFGEDMRIPSFHIV